MTDWETNDTTYTEQRTALDPEAFVRDLDGIAWINGAVLRVRLVSIDGETKTGRKRFTIEVTKVTEVHS